MFVKDRQSGTRNWVPGLFAVFWILLAAVSAVYLYQLVTNPPSPRVEAALASPAATTAPPSPQPAQTPPPLSAEQAAQLTQAIKNKDRELAELRNALNNLSSQVAAFGTRLKPIEKVLGPVAALPTSRAVTTSPPSPGAMQPTEKPPEPPETSAAPPAAAVPPPGQTGAEAEPAAPPPSEKPADQATAESSPAPASAVSGSSDPKPSAPGPVVVDEPASDSAASTETANLEAPPSIPPGTTRFGIEIGSVDKQDGIRSMWRNLLTNHAALVAGLQARRIIAPDKKWRLIAGPFSSAAEAMQACILFKKAEMPCEATVFAGDAL